MVSSRNVLSWSRRPVLAGLIAGALLLSTSWSASASAQRPEEVVQGVTERIVDLAQASLPDGERGRQVEQLLAETVAVDRLAKAVLGRHWRTASEAQRDQFVGLLPGYLRSTYGSRLGEAQGYRLEIGAAKPLTAGDMVVPAQARRDGGAPVAIDWRVTPGPEGWRILDVVVEGVSLALAWRNEFDAVIARRGLDGLLDEMARRVEPRMASAK